MALNKPSPLVAVSTHRKLEAADLVNLFSMPSREEMATLDEVEVACRECGASWAVTLTVDHAVSRGTCNSLLAHAKSHQPGAPGMRRIS